MARVSAGERRAPRAHVRRARGRRAPPLGRPGGGREPGLDRGRRVRDRALPLLDARESGRRPARCRRHRPARAGRCGGRRRVPGRRGHQRDAGQRAGTRGMGGRSGAARAPVPPRAGAQDRPPLRGRRPDRRRSRPGGTRRPPPRRLRRSGAGRRFAGVGLHGPRRVRPDRRIAAGRAGRRRPDPQRGDQCRRADRPPGHDQCRGQHLRRNRPTGGGCRTLAGARGPTCRPVCARLPGRDAGDRGARLGGRRCGASGGRARGGHALPAHPGRPGRHGRRAVPRRQAWGGRQGGRRTRAPGHLHDPADRQDGHDDRRTSGARRGGLCRPRPGRSDPRARRVARPGVPARPRQCRRPRRPRPGVRTRSARRRRRDRRPGDPWERRRPACGRGQGILVRGHRFPGLGTVGASQGRPGRRPHRLRRCRRHPCRCPGLRRPAPARRCSHAALAAQERRETGSSWSPGTGRRWRRPSVR